ncbi:myb-like protein A isoform X2 [Calliphora vicina]|uniref:myb-like protein A isoform X2 n=1 Tax=Calliphora vicina TaxID=7373 RepID=UPI00325AD1CF
MQDISRDDFSILNEGDVAAQPTEKDLCPTLICRIQNTSPINSTAANLPKQLNNEDNAAQSFAAVKLEDINTIDLFPSHSSTWQQHPMNASHDLGHHRMFINTHNRFDHNNTKLLLQGSDDPLISHGANNVLSHDDEHPADFAKSLNTQANNHLQYTVNKQSHHEGLPKLSNQQTGPQRLVKSGCSNLTKQQLKVKANLMSARNQQQQQSQNNTSSLNISTAPTTVNQKHQRSQKTKNKKGTTTVKLRFHHQALPPEYLSHYEATQGQRRLSKNLPKLNISNQRSSSKSSNSLQKQSQPRNSHENVRSWLQKIAEIQRTANASKETAIQAQKQIQKHHCQPNTDKRYESPRTITRIPKDANNNSQLQSGHETQNKSSLTHLPTHDGSLIAEVNNYSISKRSYYSDLPYMGEITLDNCKPRRGRKPKKSDICHLIYKNYGTILPKKTKPENCFNYSSPFLNVENHSNKNEGYEQPLNLCLRDQLNDSYSISSGDELSETNSSCPTPVSTPHDYVRDSMLANNLKNTLSNINEKTNDENVIKTSYKPSTTTSEEKVMHPITMYYQKLLESGVLLHNVNGPFKTIQKDNQLALKIPIPSGLFLPQKLEKFTNSPIGSNLEYPDPLSTPSSIKSDTSLATTISSTTNQQQMAPHKRKRSAIFIPPMNVENTTNPVTEVSICKFKFTGGSKPTLQEKKMVSVDAGGNYRYFSGTGDKASRGYEYFSRECLQHTAGLLPGVNCTGQKLAIDISPPSAGLSNDLLQIPESPTSSVLLSGRSINGNTMTDSISPKSTSYESNNVINKSLCGTT